jgi:response regulator RpfG family c-di-GMP phosphodiesterase
MKKITHILSRIRMSKDEHIKTWNNIVQKTGIKKTPLHRVYAVRFALASVFVGVLTITPVSYAAERSVPGDITYPLKTNVIEPLKEKLLLKEERKAEYQKKLVEKREKELQKLEMREGVAQEKVEKAREAIEKQEQKIEKSIQRLEKKGKTRAVEVLREVQQKKQEKRRERIEKFENRGNKE